MDKQVAFLARKNLPRTMPKRSATDRSLEDGEDNLEQSELSNVRTITKNSEFLQAVDKDANRLVVANFFIPGSPACQQMRPIMYQIANKYPNALFLEVRFLK